MRVRINGVMRFSSYVSESTGRIVRNCFQGTNELLHAHSRSRWKRSVKRICLSYYRTSLRSIEETMDHRYDNLRHDDKQQL